MKDSHRFTNDLIHETSPYLLQHAHNPVQWRAWNEETLALAKKEDKPLLISIGYSACHWCHVMEYESFENEEVAEIMNEHFICVKVDREERPDVDQVYMSAVQLITGSGGWPLNCFALPDGRPFHGGTYFRRAQWISTLKAIHKEFTDNREKLEKFADRLTKGVVQGNVVPKAISKQESYKPIFERTLNKWKEDMDLEWGGPDREPKFPLPNNYQFLLHYAFQTQDKALLNYVELTLDKMAKGGLFDQIGGGFARYSTDKYWKVPHFEKMLYDNAQLLSLYAQAYAALGKKRYKEVLDLTVDFIDRELTDKTGAFYSALDADSEGVEGKFYVWSEEELKELFGEDYSLLEDLYILDRFGEWEGNFILMENLPPSQIQEKHHLTADQFNSKKSMITDRLMKMRSKRIRPGLDDKTLTSWNALTISGLLDTYRSTGNEKALKLAKKNLDFVFKHQVSKTGAIWHNYKNGKSNIKGFIEDYAFVIQACLDMYEISAESEQLRRASELMEYCRNKFFDDQQNMFRFNELDDKELIVNSIEYQDNVIPSSNSVMATNLYRLYIATANTLYLEQSEAMLAPIAELVPRYGSSFSNWAQLMMHKDYQHFELVIVGKGSEEIKRKLDRYYLPHVTLIASEKGSDDALFDSRYQQGKTLLYLCRGNVCEAPVDESKLEEIISKIKLVRP